MDEKKQFSKQFIKNLIINFVIFTSILLVFDFIIYNQVSNSVYNSIDLQLNISMERFSSPEKEETEDAPKKNKIEHIDNPDNVSRMKDKINPRMINLIRNENGEIENIEDMGNLVDYKEQITFNPSNLGKIYTLQIENRYFYRCINFETTKDGEKVYMQMLLNVDGEKVTLENMVNTLIIGTACLVIVSMILSYILSKRSMKPIMEAYKRQTEFVQNASHELRTPLAIIQGKQELLLKEPDKKIVDQIENINLTLKETRRLTKLIKNLMDLARADDGNIEMQKESVNINKIIESILVPYMELADMQGKKIVLDLKCIKYIKVNKSKISELLIIVLDNAIKYTNEGDTITSKTYEKEGKCNIEIQDTGIGISDEGIKHVFERFYRDDKARTRKTGGNGLGLAIAKTIVSQHDGTIKAVHNKPKGTIIKIQLPIS